VELRRISEALNCTVLTGDDDMSIDVQTVAASDGMSEILACPSPGALMITGLINIQSVRAADVADVRAIVYVRGKHPNAKVIALARQKGIALLATEFGMFDACGILRNHGLKGTM